MFFQIGVYLVEFFGDGIFTRMFGSVFDEAEGDDISNVFVGY